MPKRYRGWCYTLNNYTQSDIQRAHDINNISVYGVFGFEVGSGGNPHLQGYSYFKNPKCLRQVVALLPGAHFEQQKGTFKQAIDYCKKDGDYHENGRQPSDPFDKGRRGVEFWDEQLALAKEGRIEEMDSKLQLTIGVQLERIAIKYRAPPSCIDSLDNHWYWGEPGSGKSRKAFTDHPQHYRKACNKWWDGYNGQEVVIIEDFELDHHVLLHHLKIWCDHYPFLGEIKNGTIFIRPRTIIVTSNYSPVKIWPDDEKCGPILRRFRMHHFDIPYPHRVLATSSMTPSPTQPVIYDGEF